MIDRDRRYGVGAPALMQIPGGDGTDGSGPASYASVQSVSSARW